jgi:hypothetical protein
MERYCLWGHYTHALLTEGLGLQDSQLHIGGRAGAAGGAAARFRVVASHGLAAAAAWAAVRGPVLLGRRHLAAAAAAAAAACAGAARTPAQPRCWLQVVETWAGRSAWLWWRARSSQT